MSTCPENDIHSVYLDGELPPAYMAEYEAHVAECESCRAKLENLRAMRAAFLADSKSITLDSHAVNASFERLLTKRSYKKHCSQGNGVLTLDGVKSSLKYVVTGAAAAAVVALVVPVRGNRNSSAQNVAAFQPVARTNIVSPASMAVPRDTDSVALASLFAEQEGSYAPPAQLGMQGTMFTAAANPAPAAVMQLSGSQYAVPVSNRSSLASYNVFGPVPQEGTMPPPEAQKKGFSFHVSSPLGNISLEIGNGN